MYIAKDICLGLSLYFVMHGKLIRKKNLENYNEFLDNALLQIVGFSPVCVPLVM